MPNLTTKQKLVLVTISDYISTSGYSPSIREIGEKVNLASTSTVQRYLERLKEKGYVTWKPGQSRTLQILEKAVQ